MPFAQALPLEPLRNDARDRETVLLDHHHVAVAVHAQLGEPDVRITHTRLGEVGRGAMVIGRVIGRFRADDDDRRLREARQPAGGFLLQPTS